MGPEADDAAHDGPEEGYGPEGGEGLGLMGWRRVMCLRRVTGWRWVMRWRRVMGWRG